MQKTLDPLKISADDEAHLQIDKLVSLSSFNFFLNTLSRGPSPYSLILILIFSFFKIFATSIKSSKPFFSTNLPAATTFKKLSFLSIIFFLCLILEKPCGIIIFLVLLSGYFVKNLSFAAEVRKILYILLCGFLAFPE